MKEWLISGFTYTSCCELWITATAWESCTGMWSLTMSWSIMRTEDCDSLIGVWQNSIIRARYLVVEESSRNFLYEFTGGYTIGPGGNLKPPPLVLNKHYSILVMGIILNDNCWLLRRDRFREQNRFSVMSNCYSVLLSKLVSVQQSTIIIQNNAYH